MRRLVMTMCMVTGGLLAAANGAAAQEPARRPVEGRFGLDLLTTSLGNDAATTSGTGVRGWGFLLNGSVASGFVGGMVDLGILDVADHDAFTQNTTGGEFTSSVTLVTESVSAGLRIPPRAVDATGRTKLSAGANVGYTLAQARRGISNCTDCHVDHLSVSGGGFVEPSVSLYVGRSAFSARARMFESKSDLRNALILGWSYLLSGKSHGKTMTAPSPAPASGTTTPPSRR